MKCKTVIKDFLYYNRKIIIKVVIGILLIVCFLFLKGENSFQEEPVMEESPIDFSNENETTPKKELVVDIKGEVKNPGIYRIEEEKRIIDVIDLAGGLLEQADTTSINLSKKVSDEMVIIIPKKLDKIEESNEVSSYPVNDYQKENQKVSINTASKEELMSVSGIGKVKAESILAYRQEHGLFHNLEDLKKVNGIGNSTFEKIKDFLTL